MQSLAERLRDLDRTREKTRLMRSLYNEDRAIIMSLRKSLQTIQDDHKSGRLTPQQLDNFQRLLIMTIQDGF